MNKWIFSLTLVLLVSAFLGAQSSTQAEIREFDLREMVNITIEPLDPVGAESIEEITRRAKDFLISRVKGHLQRYKLAEGLYHIDISHNRLVTYAAPAVNVEIAKYLQSGFSSELSRSLNVKIIFAQLEPEHMKILPHIASKEVPEQQHQKITVWGMERSTADNWVIDLKRAGVVVHETPRVIVSNGFISKLVMTAKQPLSYVKSYRPTWIPGKVEPLMVPELGELNRALQFWLLPEMNASEKMVDLQAFMEMSDYAEPVKTENTESGPVHHPEIYYQSGLIHVNGSFPSVLALLINAQQTGKEKDYLALIELTPALKKAGKTKSTGTSSLIKIKDELRFSRMVDKQAIPLADFTRELFRDKKIALVGQNCRRAGHVNTLIAMVDALGDDTEFKTLCLDFPTDWQDRFDYVLTHDDQRANTFFTAVTPPNEPGYPKYQELFNRIKRINQKRSKNEKIRVYAISVPRKWRKDKYCGKFIKSGLQPGYMACKILEIYEANRGKILVSTDNPALEKKSSAAYNVQLQRVFIYSLREMLDRLLPGFSCSIVQPDFNMPYLKEQTWKGIVVLPLAKSGKILKYENPFFDDVPLERLVDVFDAMTVNKNFLEWEK